MCFCELDLGFELPRGSCSGRPDSASVHVVSQSEGHLSSRSVRHSGHGTEHCPWLIVVQPGKTIDLYVIDFALTSRYQVCHRWALRGLPCSPRFVFAVHRCESVSHERLWSHLHRRFLEKSKIPNV